MGILDRIGEALATAAASIARGVDDRRLDQEKVPHHDARGNLVYFDARTGERKEFRRDGWRSALTGFGVAGRDKRIGTNFVADPLSFDECLELWRGDDLAARAVDTLPKDAFREGYELLIQDDEIDSKEWQEELEQWAEQIGIDQLVQTGCQYERGYGGSAVLLGALDNQDDLTKPLDLKRVRDFQWMTPLEAREIMPLYGYADPMAPKYGEPEIYQLISRAVLPSYSGKYYSQTRMIHASRLLVFPGVRVSRYQVTTSNGGWGDSILTRMHRVLRDFNISWAAAGVLMTDFSQAVYKMKGLYEALATDGDDKLIQRLKAMELGRSIVNATVIDADDEWMRQSTALTGFPEMLIHFWSRLAATVDMPLTKLAGQSPKGLGNEGESDIVWWNASVGNYQRTHVGPRVRRAYQIKMIQRWGREPKKWSLKWRSLEKENPKDLATARNLQAQTDKIYAVDIGSITSQEVAESRFGGDGYSFETQLDMVSRKAQEAVEPQGTEAERAALRPGPGDEGYVPPPPTGSAVPTAPIPAPGPAAAPDPNTPPMPVVETGDS